MALKRVALFRAADDARKSAAHLAELGFEAVIAPVLEPVALDAAIPSGQFDVVVATSAKALDHVHPELLARFAKTPLYVVGSAGEAAAARRGLSVAATAEAAASLARLLVVALPGRRRVLYLAGTDRKPELESALDQAGLSVVTAEVYAAQARCDWSDDEARSVASCRAALHYSRRSAELARNFAARAGIVSQWQAMLHVTISADAAEPLGVTGVNVAVAAAPREEAMLAALTEFSQQDATMGQGSLPRCAPV